MRDYSEQIERMENHLLSHPKDAQTKVQLMIARSRQIDNQYKNAMIPILKRVAKIRKERLDDEQECKQ